MKTRYLLLASFLLLSTSRVIFSAEGPQKWEYKVLAVSAGLEGTAPGAVSDSAKLKILEKELNQLGSEGWELCATGESAYVFKRPSATLPTAAPVAFTGQWKNTNPNTNGNTRFEMRQDDDVIFVRAWGRCHPEDCYWGEIKSELRPGISPELKVVWNKPFAVTAQTLRLLTNGTLEVSSHTHFTDQSGRSDYESLATFAKERVRTNDNLDSK